MVNVNVQLPPVISMPFQPATESLQRENLRKPIISKTENVSAYVKMRDGQTREQVADQAEHFIQKDLSQPKPSQNQSILLNHKREFFFASKLKLAANEDQLPSDQSPELFDYKKIVSVIQEKYLNAVSPLPSATVSCNV